MQTMLSQIGPTDSSSGVNGAPVLPVPTTGWHQIYPSEIPALWNDYRDLLLSVLERGDGYYAEHDVLAMLLLGKWILIAIEGPDGPISMAILEVADFPRKRVMLVKYAAGDLKAIEDGKGWLMEQAKALGCHVLLSYARRGWMRKGLTDWKQTYVVLEKEIE